MQHMRLTLGSSWMIFLVLTATCVGGCESARSLVPPSLYTLDLSVQSDLPSRVVQGSHLGISARVTNNGSESRNFEFSEDAVRLNLSPRIDISDAILEGTFWQKNFVASPSTVVAIALRAEIGPGESRSFEPYNISIDVPIGVYTARTCVTLRTSPTSSSSIWCSQPIPMEVTGPQN